MKKIVALFAVTAVVFGCEKKAQEVSEPITLPFEVTYKGTVEIGNMKNVQTVMEWNKRLSALNTDIGDLLADSVSWHLQDGFELNTVRDSAVAVIKGMVGDMTSVKVIYTAAVPVNNPTAKHEWVFSWTDETYTHKDGTIEHHFMHEDYRLEGGKIREVFQYARKDAPAKPAQ